MHLSPYRPRSEASRPKSPQVFGQLLDHARRQPHRECCGLLAGQDNVITRAFPAKNIAAEPSSWLRAFARKLQSNQSGPRSDSPHHRLPESLSTETPLNLHKCVLAGGFLQTAVSDAPRSELHVDSGVRRGASDTALAFLDNFRVAECPPGPSSFEVLLPSMQCSLIDESGNLFWSGGVDRVAPSLSAKAAVFHDAVLSCLNRLC